MREGISSVDDSKPVSLSSTTFITSRSEQLLASVVLSDLSFGKSNRDDPLKGTTLHNKTTLITVKGECIKT